MSGDVAMRELGKGLPVPEFESTAFTEPDKPLSESTVAIVTSAALHRQGQEDFGPMDTGWVASPSSSARRADSMNAGPSGLWCFWTANRNRRSRMELTVPTVNI
jgi:hypothetical protein